MILQRYEPYDYEIFFEQLLSGVRINREYDILTDVCNMEVKSCSIRNKGGLTDRFGRYQFNVSNHVMLKLESIMENKIPLYGFIVKISDTKDMCIIKDWDSIETMIDYSRKKNYIQWYKLFGLHSVLCKTM